jgi:Tol biopolymer transport system component
LLDLASGSSAAILSHPAYDLDQPRLSQDGRWIAFVAVIAPDRTRIFVSPFRAGAATRPDDWIAVTDGTAWDDKPRWLNASQLVFYSKRDHFGCIWTQRLQPDTKRPVGPASPAYHLHTLRLSPRPLYREDFEIAVARDIVILNLVELSGNLWLTAAPKNW